MPVTASLSLLCTLVSQQPRDSTSWRAVDTRLVVATVGATALAVVYDERVARWTRTRSVHGDTNRAKAVRAATVVNEMPLTVAAVATYSVGRIAGWRTVADLGAHLTESLLVT